MSRSLTEDEKLFYAIEGDDVTTLQQLVTSDPGVSVDRVYAGACPINKSQWSLLHLCCYGGKYDCAKILLDAGAYPDIPDKHGMTPLMYSVQVEWRHLTRLFLQAGAQVNVQEKRGRTPLHVAAQAEDPRLLEMLLKESSEHPDVNKCCLEGNTPLALTVSSDGHVTHLRHLLEAGSDVNVPDVRNKQTPLQMAILRCSDDLLTYMSILLDHEATTKNVDRFNHNVLMSLMKRRKTEPRHNALLLAAAMMLLEVDEDIVNVVGVATRRIHFDGGSLHMAVEYDQNDLLKLMLQHGGNPNVRNSQGLSPLHFSVIHNNIMSIPLLIQHGCDTTVASTAFIHGDIVLCGTAFRFALELSTLQMALLMLDFGHSLAVEDFLWNSGSTEHIGLPRGLVENTELWTWLKEEFEMPPSLLRMCRRVMRLSMVAFLGKMCQNTDYQNILPLPPRLVQYVLMSDFV